jgi:glycosyltransferase involved in cell wall biosynthesis
MKLLIFDLEVDGHHAGHLCHLLRYWPNANDQLTLVVSPEFLSRRKDVVQTASRVSVTWSPITPAELRWYEGSKRSLLRHSWVEWRLYCRYAEKIAADQGLIMYVDRFQLPLGLRFRLPCKTSGIFFRPKFHYSQLHGQRPSRAASLHGLREKWLWRSLLHHPQFNILFCPDPLAIVSLRQLGKSPVVALPDPILWQAPASAAVDSLRKTLNIEGQRKICLLFGALHERKGILQLVEAMKLLDESQRQQIALLLVGELKGDNQERLFAAIAAAQQLAGMQLIFHNHFVEEATVPVWFTLADLVLAPYQQHVGTSAILLWSAAAGKPVLSSDYGLMGETARRHQLGHVVDSTQPAAIAKGLSALLTGEPSRMINRAKATRFAQENRAERFVETIYTHLLPMCAR